MVINDIYLESWDRGDVIARTVALLLLPIMAHEAEFIAAQDNVALSCLCSDQASSCVENANGGRVG